MDGKKVTIVAIVAIHSRACWVPLISIGVASARVPPIRSAKHGFRCVVHVD